MKHTNPIPKEERKLIRKIAKEVKDKVKEAKK